MIEQTTNAQLIYEIQMDAFRQYETARIPSSAMQETVRSITDELQTGASAYSYVLDGRCVGAVRCRIEGDVLTFYRLAVLPKERGKGIATALIRHVERDAKRQHVRTIRCTVRMNVKENVALYERLGYVLVKEERNERGDDDLLVGTMEKSLGSK